MLTLKGWRLRQRELRHHSTTNLLVSVQKLRQKYISTLVSLTSFKFSLVFLSLYLFWDYITLELDQCLIKLQKSSQIFYCLLIFISNWIVCLILDWTVSDGFLTFYCPKCKQKPLLTKSDNFLLNISMIKIDNCCTLQQNCKGEILILVNYNLQVMNQKFIVAVPWPELLSKILTLLL